MSLHTCSIADEGTADGAVYEDGTRGNSTEEWDDKAIALESLAGYTRLGALYAPYLEESMQIALDGLRPTYSVMVMEVSLHAIAKSR